MSFAFKSTVVGRSFVSTPSCSVCIESFDDNKHLPRILQCAHTICETCLQLLEEQGRLANRVIPTDRNFVCVRCPTCRIFTQTSRGSIRTNYQLMDVVEKMREEHMHRISFLMCTSCEGLYHERDTNLCSTCSPYNERTSAQQLLEQDARLDKHALCSTCLLREHILKGHGYIKLQPLRCEMQRIANFRRINIHRENVFKAQQSLRERLDQIMENFNQWTAKHEENLELFRVAHGSFEQKTVFDALVKQFTNKIVQIEQMEESVSKWSQEVGESESTPRPDSPGHPVRPDTPIMVQENMPPPIFYF